MRKPSTSVLEKGTQALSPSPDLIPAKNQPTLNSRNSHSTWNMERGHISCKENHYSDHQPGLCVGKSDQCLVIVEGVSRKGDRGVQDFVVGC
jgi:hypothetical protein